MLTLKFFKAENAWATPEKGPQNKLKESRRKEIIKNKAEIHEVINR